MNKRDLHQSDPRLLSDLMNLEALPDWQPDELAAMFLHQLRSELLPGQSFGDVLHAASPDIEQLNRVKDFGKTHRNDPASPLPQDIASVLYFAAIAVNRHISRLDDASLRQGFEWVAALPWIDEATRSLVRQALDHVRG